MVGLLTAGRSPWRQGGAALTTGALFGAAADHFGRHLVLAPYCVFFAMLVVISVTDLTHRLVPRRAIYGAMALDRALAARDRGPRREASTTSVERPSPVRSPSGCSS